MIQAVTEVDIAEKLCEKYENVRVVRRPAELGARIVLILLGTLLMGKYE
jgi:hypothetical protein